MSESNQMVIDAPSRELTAASTENQAAVLLETLQRAVDQGANPDVLEKLLDMSERIQDRQAAQDFWTAFHHARSAMPPIKAKGWNDTTKSSFPLLEDVKQTIEPIYSAHGFSMMMSTDVSPLDDHVRLMGTIAHVGGHSETRSVDIPLDMHGMKGSQNKTKTHGTGSAMTYGERYLLKLIWNLTIIRNPSDDDGNAAGGEVAEVIDENELANLLALGEEVQCDWDVFLEYFKVAKIENLSKRQATKAFAMLEAKRSK